MFKRRLLEVIKTRFAEEPVVILEGARAVGKSTILQAISRDLDVPIIDLDDLATRSAVSNDPSHFVGGSEPVLIDEYQKVPVILDAIKAELNKATYAGRYLLTGSVRSEKLPRGTQALTGRVHHLVVPPLMQCEIEGTRIDLLNAILEDPDGLIIKKGSKTDRLNYANRVTTGGFPIVLNSKSLGQRNRWLRDYIHKTLSQDVQEISRIQQKELLPRLLTLLASQNAQVLNTAKISREIELNAITTDQYIKLLESLFIAQRIPAWGRRLNARSIQKPKIQLLDSGLLSHLAKLTPEKITGKSAAAATEFGHAFESFVTNEFLRLAQLRDDFIAPGHWRTHDSDEVDLVLEFQTGAIVGIEVKAGKMLSDSDFRGLRKLKDYVGSDFHCGILMYQGEFSYRNPDGLFAVPADRLWID